jgi:hypothetical protein
MNLAPCGDNDGGLVVLKGGHEISKEYHDAFRQEERGFRWTNEVRRSPASSADGSAYRTHAYRCTFSKTLDCNGCRSVATNGSRSTASPVIWFCVRGEVVEALLL